MPVQTRNIMILAILEGSVVTAAVVRMLFSDGGMDLSKKPTLFWFIGVVMMAGASVAQYVVRSSLLMPRMRAGERVDDELKQVLGVSAAIIALAGLLVIAGPGAVAGVIG